VSGVAPREFVAFVSGPSGRARLAAAVGAAMAAQGAPTRPGGEPAVLAERWAAGEPLAEDTDWRAPLGPFRDTGIVRGTLDELLSARLTDGRFGLDVVLDALLPDAIAELGPLVDALDPYDLRQRCRGLLRQVVAGLGDEALRGLLGGPGGQ
jgi:hypothetical protein